MIRQTQLKNAKDSMYFTLVWARRLPVEQFLAHYGCACRGVLSRAPFLGGSRRKIRLTIAYTTPECVLSWDTI